MRQRASRCTDSASAAVAARQSLRAQTGSRSATKRRQPPQWEWSWLLPSLDLRALHQQPTIATEAAAAAAATKRRQPLQWEWSWLLPSLGDSERAAALGRAAALTSCDSEPLHWLLRAQTGSCSAMHQQLGSRCTDSACCTDSASAAVAARQSLRAQTGSRSAMHQQSLH